ncbi:MAG: hypothetical protein HY047_09030 [Acidobacteria bacterium]|nr:hypothetical protein [Acidobacteriota bacterium]
MTRAGGSGEVAAGGRATSRAPPKPVNASASGPTHGATDLPLTPDQPDGPTDGGLSLEPHPAPC